MTRAIQLKHGFYLGFPIPGWHKTRRELIAAAKSLAKECARVERQCAGGIKAMPARRAK